MPKIEVVLKFCEDEILRSKVRVSLEVKIQIRKMYLIFQMYHIQWINGKKYFKS